MSYLPPVGWADVATKRDLEALDHRIEASISREAGTLRSEMATQTRTFLFWTSGLLLTLATVAFAAAQLA